MTSKWHGNVIFPRTKIAHSRQRWSKPSVDARQRILTYNDPITPETAARLEIDPALPLVAPFGFSIDMILDFILLRYCFFHCLDGVTLSLVKPTVALIITAFTVTVPHFNLAMTAYFSFVRQFLNIHSRTYIYKWR